MQGLVSVILAVFCAVVVIANILDVFLFAYQKRKDKEGE